MNFFDQPSMYVFTKSAIVTAGLLAVSAWAHTITITEPAESRAYHRPAQSIDVVTEVRPALSDGMSVHLLVGDVNLGIGMTGSVPTVEFNPGEHTIRAIVLDKDGNQVSSAERVVYVIQNNRIHRQRQAAQAEYDRYQALPWYQKLYLNMRQDFERPTDPNATSSNR